MKMELGILHLYSSLLFSRPLWSLIRLVVVSRIGFGARRLLPGCRFLAVSIRS